LGGTRAWRKRARWRHRYRGRAQASSWASKAKKVRLADRGDACWASSEASSLLCGPDWCGSHLLPRWGNEVRKDEEQNQQRG